MTYGNRPDYALADKMKNRFSGRGAAVSGMRASSTSELVRTAQMGGDPSENCSELDFRSGAGRQPANAQNSAPGYRPAYAYPAYAETSARTANPAGTRTRPAEPRKQGTAASGTASGSGIASGSGNTSGSGKNAIRNARHGAEKRKARTEAQKEKEREDLSKSSKRKKEKDKHHEASPARV